MNTKQKKSRRWYFEKAKLHFLFATISTDDEEREFYEQSSYVLMRHALFCTVEDAKFVELKNKNNGTKI